jgi:hypothetical protein
MDFCHTVGPEGGACRAEVCALPARPRGLTLKGAGLSRTARMAPITDMPTTGIRVDQERLKRTALKKKVYSQRRGGHESQA